MVADPLALVSVTGNSRGRYPLRCLMLDRSLDAFLLALEVLVRPVSRGAGRLLGRSAPPWEWLD